jgi:hypothetical protein
MAEELAIPQVPEPKPEDPEDVSWALSTAEAMWARGDHAEGIKWVRRAAEAASEAENDGRALELAKAAADLTAMITRRSIVLDDPPAQKKAPPVPPSNRTLGGGPGAPTPPPAPAAESSRRSVPPVGRTSSTPHRTPPIPSSFLNRTGRPGSLTTNGAEPNR